MNSLRALWLIDIDENGSADLEVGFVSGQITINPAIGNSVLVFNRSYITNISSFPDPVIVGLPDEPFSLAKEAIVPFFNPGMPFWRERQASGWQPLMLPMPFPPGEAEAVATNYFAMKLRIDNNWVLAWVRVRLTPGPNAACLLDWGRETRPIHEITIGSRPSPSTIRSIDQGLGLPIFDATGVDLDGDGSPDFYFGGAALTTFAEPTNASVRGPIPDATLVDGARIIPPSTVFSYGAGTSGQNEFLRDNQSIWVLQTGGGIGDFVPPATFWFGGNAELISSGPGTNVMWTGHLVELGNGFMGIRLFRKNDYFFGWIQLQLADESIGGSFGPSILGWALKTRPQVPIIAGARGVIGDIVLDPPVWIGDQITVNVTGLSRSNVILAASVDLIHWTPLITNSIPFKFIDSASSFGATGYFHATVEN